MLAAIAAARNDHQVILLEKNEKLGKKLFITGKGRCNITNACDKETFFEQIVTNPKFMFKAYHTFSNYDAMDFFEQLGLPIKVERGNRVFPESDKSSDVITVLRKELERLSVMVRYKSEVTKLIIKEGTFYGLKIKNSEETFLGDAVIVTTGGLSYPVTGSTGDGYRFAKEMGHTVTAKSFSGSPLYQGTLC